MSRYITLNNITYTTQRELTYLNAEIEKYDTEGLFCVELVRENLIDRIVSIEPQYGDYVGDWDIETLRSLANFVSDTMRHSQKRVYLTYITDYGDLAGYRITKQEVLPVYSLMLTEDLRSEVATYKAGEDSETILKAVQEELNKWEEYL